MLKVKRITCIVLAWMLALGAMNISAINVYAQDNSGTAFEEDVENLYVEQQETQKIFSENSSDDDTGLRELEGIDEQQGETGTTEASVSTEGAEAIEKDVSTEEITANIPKTAIIKNFAELEHNTYYLGDNEQSIQMCLNNFPTTLKAYVDDKTENVEISVTWKLSDTYSSENGTVCYEYIPEWDLSCYVISDENTVVVPTILIEAKCEEENVEDNDDPEYARAMGYAVDGFAEDTMLLSDISFAGAGYVHNSKYANYNIYTGIDVSKYQGWINWNEVKASGVEFAIIRVGYRGYSNGRLVEDEYFRTNIEGALAAGLKVGVYIFSQAITDAEAVEEANFIMDRISSYNITLPVVIDYEYAGSGTGRLYDANLSIEAATSICNSFCRVVQSRGYTGMVYANKYMLENRLNASGISTNYKIWLANYTSSTSYAGEYSFWQYSSSGFVPGIGGYVDCDFWYAPKDGVCIGTDGLWHYYRNGDVDKNFTGIAENSDGAWYFANGTLDWGYTGMAVYENTWRYVSNGKVDFSYTGVGRNSEGYWYFRDGVVDFSYTGVIQNATDYWYFRNGTVDYLYTGMIVYKNTWRYVESGKVNFMYTGMACNSEGWWYFDNGEIDWNYTGMACNSEGWWYFNNGALDWDYTGAAHNSEGRWYFQNGRINWAYTGMIIDINAWRYVSRGKVDFSYTGMACNLEGWWYFNNGALDWNYTGIGENTEGRWYFKNGNIQFDFSGSVIINQIEYQVIRGKVV